MSSSARRPRSPGEGATAAVLALSLADFEGGERPRKALRARALAFFRAVLPRFARDGIDLTLEPVGDHGRDGGSDRHGVTLLLRPRRGRVGVLRFGLDRDEVSVSFEPSADGLRALQKCLDEGALEPTLARLPDPFEVRSGPADGPTESAFVAALDRRELQERVSAAKAPHEPLRIGWFLPRDVAIEHAALLDEQLADALLALAPLLRAVGGEAILRPPPVVHDRAASPRTRVQRALAAFRQGEQQRPTLALHSSSQKALGRSSGTSGTPGTSGTAGSSSPFAARHVLGRSGAARIRLGSSLTARTNALRGAEVVDRGTRVRVLQGPFEGKEGVVQELDGKGSARVLLGLLSARLELVDLTPATTFGPRPPSSSHLPVAEKVAPLEPPRRTAFSTSHRRRT